ncbi:hypothetical protein D8847_09770 [Streptococcus mitis]|uniref:Uncharacterized protein n=1 Tax=Streptococcus mitis TaxID=28037 RepID=A0A3R9J0J3_STRMT|nr:hypothetical protein D8847_09770 [Streptococcus mitis]
MMELLWGIIKFEMFQKSEKNFMSLEDLEQAAIGRVTIID